MIVLSGEAGVGKTHQSFYFSEPIVCLDLENRNQPTKDKHFPDKFIDIKKIKKHTKKYQEDYLESYNELTKQIDLLLESRNFETVIVDGISDIRNTYAVAEWKRRWQSGYYGRSKPRQKPANEGDWGQVNDIVSEVLFPLVNYCRANSVMLICTAQFTDRYEKVTAIENDEKVTKSAKTGRVPAIKDWVAYNFDTVIELYADIKTKRYTAVCTKSIAGIWQEDITGKELYKILIDKGIL